MRVLLDECFPRSLRNDIAGHEVKTVAEMGWAGIKNGQLLQRAEREFDLFLTVDRNLEYQQNFQALSLAVMIVHTVSNDVATLRRLMPSVVAAIPEAKPGMVMHIGR
jgi:hypothetical protein